MRVQLFRFVGFQAGQTNFEIVAGTPGNPTFELDQALERMTNGIAGITNTRSTITVVGHSDRQNNPAFNCDQRRQSEIDAARERAVSAWDWCREVMIEHIAGNPAAPADWWETSDRMTWDLVFAAAGMLQNGSASEAESRQNRRVDILISIFDV